MQAHGPRHSKTAKVVCNLDVVACPNSSVGDCFVTKQATNGRLMLMIGPDDWLFQFQC